MVLGSRVALLQHHLGGTTLNERQLLLKLLKELNDYNQPDQLDGYLNGLAMENNYLLEQLGLPLLEVVNQEEE